VSDRLNQGPFAIEQDDGWFTVAATSASERAVPNYGLGLVGYAWEESGPSLPRAPDASRSSNTSSAWPACLSSTCSTSAATGATCSGGSGASICRPSGA